jgi:uncharacterized surface protein with fasciclin (FAS1) repeats
LFDVLGDDYSSFDDFDSFIELELLRRILNFHVVSGNLTSASLTPGSLTSLYDQQTFEVKADGNDFVISDASAIDANIVSVDNEATNGVVHVIDKILIPADVADALGISSFPESTSSDGTIKDIVTKTEGFTVLREALALTGLLDTLDGDGPFTVFAPSDGYFTSLFAMLGAEFGSLKDFNTDLELDLLREILLYHVVPGTFESRDFTTGVIETLSGENTLTTLDDAGELVLQDATPIYVSVILTDITAQNGVVHVIDRVMIPQSILELVERSVHTAFETAMANSEQLNMALEFFRMVRDRMNLEALAERDFTFFFPSDQAFIALFNEIGYDTIEQFNTEEGAEILKTILAYHCVENQSLELNDFSNNQILQTFQGEILSVSLDSEVIILDKTSVPSKIIEGDIEVLQGVIHVVDKVLLPEAVLEAL